jgi:hypothetical protein
MVPGFREPLFGRTVLQRPLWLWLTPQPLVQVTLPGQAWMAVLMEENWRNLAGDKFSAKSQISVNGGDNRSSSRGRHCHIQVRQHGNNFLR